MLNKMLNVCNFIITITSGKICVDTEFRPKIAVFQDEVTENLHGITKKKEISYGKVYTLYI